VYLNFKTYLNNPQSLIETKLTYIKILGDVFEALVGAIFVDLDLSY
jgi:dsRNA-specific ribonuclease